VKGIGIEAVRVEMLRAHTGVAAREKYRELGGPQKRSFHPHYTKQARATYIIASRRSMIASTASPRVWRKASRADDRLTAARAATSRASAS